MSSKAKTILAVLAAITLAGVGYFFIINKPKPEILPPVNTPPQTEEIDTSDWQTYRNETLGFEIKMPKEWIKTGEDIGPQPNLEDEFWQERVGEVSFNAPFRAPSSPQFNVRVKDLDLTLEEFYGDSWERYIINGLPAKHRIADQTNLGKVRFGEFVVIKNEKRFYYIEFSSGFDSAEITEKTKILWETVLMTFKPIP